MIERIDKAMLWLDRFDFLTYKKKETILKLISSPEKTFDKNCWEELRQKLKDLIDDEELSIMDKNFGEKVADNLVEKLKENKIDFISKFSPLYPETLKNIDTPPFILYFRGDIGLLNEDCFSIVGTRHITTYGKMATEKFTAGLVDASFVIVSGLAMGVDSTAHTKTLDCGGKTIAVLAGGLDNIYPSSNTALAKRIVEGGGLIISEVRPSRKAEPYMFPIRNRIIAGISKGVLITEAQEKSGSLHTKNYALEYGKDVYAVPGSIYSISSMGTNKIISRGNAKLVCDIDDILMEYNIKIKKRNSKKVELNNEEKLIVDLLSTGEKSFQEIVERTRIEVKKVNSLLTLLTIRGIIKKLAGNVYYLNS